ncbi:MAG: hypothetical protein J6A08_08580 [Lachnospiraceae bacterium]|nr:hypothetical protein [Lachnospiraceae bacterium]
MSEIRYADAGMDMKKWMLLWISKFWIVLAAAAAGAVLGGVVYTMARIVPEAEREYQAVSKIYLDFAADETGEVYQEYNGYTWNDLMATDPILDVTMSDLPEGYTREEVMEATEATILSDLRLLTVTITTNDPGRTDTILAATDQALETYGSSAKEFIEIKTIQTTEAKLVVADSRLMQAALIGLVIAFAAVFIGMLLYYILDDRIIVAGDVKQVTDVSFIGYTFDDADAAQTARREDTQSRQRMSAAWKGTLQTHHDQAVAYLRKHHGNVPEIRVVPAEEALAELSIRGGGVSERFAGEGKEDGVILTVPYGTVHGAYLAYLIGQYEAQGRSVLGIAIGNADIAFLRRYYGRAVGRERV